MARKKKETLAKEIQRAEGALSKVMTDVLSGKITAKKGNEITRSIKVPEIYRKNG